MLELNRIMNRVNCQIKTVRDLFAAFTYAMPFEDYICAHP